MSIFSDRLKSLRKKRGYTQSRIAEELLMTLRGYQNYEMDKTQPSNLVLMELAKILNVSVAYLNGETDDPVPHKKTREQMDAENFSMQIQELIIGNRNLGNPEFIDSLLYALKKDIDLLDMLFEKNKSNINYFSTDYRDLPENTSN